MFVTSPKFEQSMPAALIGKCDRYWRATTISVDAPWFAFVYATDLNAVRVSQTTLVAWESTLLELLKSVPVCDHIALSRFEKDQRLGGGWLMRQVDRVWIPAQSEARHTGALLLRLKGEHRARDANMNEIEEREGRELLFQCPDSA